MQPSELEFCSTRDLIDELMRRRTFLGVVVHSEPEFKQQQWGEQRNFKVHFNGNLDANQASRLLERVASYMDLNLCEE